MYSKLGPFLPKVQGEFAEFLTYGYLIRLGDLYHSTSVGLGNGADRYTVFLDQRVCGTRVHIPHAYAYAHQSWCTCILPHHTYDAVLRDRVCMQ